MSEIEAANYQAGADALPEGTHDYADEHFAETPLIDDTPVALVPTIDTREAEFLEKEVHYQVGRRDPSDVVLSGPVIDGWGPGRYHQNRFFAMRHLVEKFGAHRVKRIEGQTKGRWAFLIKGLKTGD